MSASGSLVALPRVTITLRRSYARKNLMKEQSFFTRVRIQCESMERLKIFD